MIISAEFENKHYGVQEAEGAFNLAAGRSISYGCRLTAGALFPFTQA